MWTAQNHFIRTQKLHRNKIRFVLVAPNFFRRKTNRNLHRSEFKARLKRFSFCFGRLCFKIRKFSWEVSTKEVTNFFAFQQNLAKSEIKSDKKDIFVPRDKKRSVSSSSSSLSPSSSSLSSANVFDPTSSSFSLPPREKSDKKLRKNKKSCGIIFAKTATFFRSDKKSKESEEEAKKLRRSVVGSVSVENWSEESKFEGWLTKVESWVTDLIEKCSKEFLSHLIFVIAPDVKTRQPPPWRASTTTSTRRSSAGSTNWASWSEPTRGTSS